MLKNGGKCLPTITASERSFVESEHEEIETFQDENISMLCSKCGNYVNLKCLQDHRALHEALDLYQYDFQATPSNVQALSRKRAALIKDLNKLLSLSRSAYSKKLGKIDLAYEIIKSTIYGRSNKVKPPFIEHHDVIIRSVRVKLPEGFVLGVCESANEEWTSVMEDSFSYTCDSTEGQRITYFAVFDGYSGATAAKQCSAQFYPILKEALGDINLKKCIKGTSCQIMGGFQQAFTNMDKILLHGTDETSRNRWSGCSATTCVIMDGTLHVANVGNVKATLVKDDSSFQTLTEDHIPNNKKEKHRIKANADIHKWSKTMWVNGVVMTTRGLGNHGDPILKSSIINVPTVSCVPLADIQIILVASRGFWQVFDESEAVLLIKELLKGHVNKLDSVEHKVNSGKNSCDNSVEMVIQNEGSFKTEASDTINSQKEDILGYDNLNIPKTGDHESCTSLNEKQCSQCLHRFNTACTCVTSSQESSPSMKESINYHTSNTSQANKGGTPEDEGLLSILLRDFVMRYNADYVAVEISKYLTKAALTGGTKENITVLVVIPSMNRQSVKL